MLITAVRFIDCCHSDHSRIGRGIRWRRRRPAVTRRGNCNDALLIGSFQELLDRRITRADEAHIEDPGTFFDRPIYCSHENMRRCFRGRPRIASPERAHGQDLRLWCYALDEAMGTDDASHCRPVEIRSRVRATGSIERAPHRTPQVWVPGIDIGVDYGDDDVAAEGHLMRTGQAHLARSVLWNGRRVLAPIARTEIAPLRLSGVKIALVSRASVEIAPVKLGGTNPPVSLQRRQDNLLRLPFPDAEEFSPSTQQRNRLAAQLLQAIGAGELIAEGWRVILIDQHENLAHDRVGEHLPLRWQL